MNYNYIQLAELLNTNQERARALMDLCGYWGERVTEAQVATIRAASDLGRWECVPVEELRQWPEAKVSRAKRIAEHRKRLGWGANESATKSRKATKDRRAAEKRKQGAIKARLSREGLPEK